MKSKAATFKKEIKNCSTPLEQVNYLNNKAWESCRLDTLKSMDMSHFALAIAEENEIEKGKIDAFLTLSQCHCLLGNYVQAIDYLVGILPKLETKKYLKEYAEALSLFGSIYSGMDNLQEAEDYFKKTLVIREEIGEKEGIARTLNGIGDTLMRQKQFSEALEVFHKTAEIAHSNETYKGIVRYNIAEAQFYLYQFEESKESISKCLKIGEKLSFPLMIIYANSLLAKIHIEEGNLSAAKELLISVLALAKKTQNMERITQIYLDLSRVNERNGNITMAFSYFKLYQELKDSILTRESNERLKAIEYQSELEATRKEIEREKGINKELQAANETIEAIKNALTNKNQEMIDSIRYAKHIQQALLPSEELIKEIFPESFVMYRPKDILSGDFYWTSRAVTNKSEKIKMASVVDCTGHGVPGALMSIIGNSFLRFCEIEATVNRPSEALDFINVGISNTLRQEYGKSMIRDGMDMVFIAYDEAEQMLHFAGAKNPIYIVRNSELIEYKGDKHPIGAFIGEVLLKFTNHSIPTQKDDQIYLFTDGYPDQFGGQDGKKFMYRRFRELLLEISTLKMSEQLQILEQTFNGWKGDLEQVDDVCVMGIKI